MVKIPVPVKIDWSRSWSNWFQNPGPGQNWPIPVQVILKFLSRLIPEENIIELQESEHIIDEENIIELWES